MREITQISKLKRTLFGLHPAKVSAHFRVMKKLQAQQVAELEEQVQALLLEQETLRKERAEAEASLQAKTQELQYQDLILQRAQEAVEVLRAHAQQEMAEMQRAVDRKQAEHRQKMRWIEQQIEADQQTMHTLLQELGETVLQFNQTSLERLVMPDILPELVATLDNDSELSSVSNTEAERLEVGGAKAEHPPNKPQELHLARQPVDLTAKIGRTGPTPVQAKQTSTFWGSIDTFFESDNLPEYAENAKKVDELLPFPSAEASAASEAVAELASQDATERTTALEAKPHAQVAASRQSDAVTTEIASVRNRYIVGKIAGEDLIDAGGQLLLAKGESITEEAVNLAERAGVLPDLIVNMKVPGMSERS